MQSISGQFEKYDHSDVGRMEIEIPKPVKESCFLLRELSKGDEIFQKYSTDGQGGLEFMDLQTFLQVIHDYELLGPGQHQVTKLVARRTFQRISGRWTKNVPLETFIKCLLTLQEYLIFQTLSMMDVQILGSSSNLSNR